MQPSNQGNSRPEVYSIHVAELVQSFGTNHSKIVICNCHIGLQVTTTALCVLIYSVTWDCSLYYLYLHLSYTYISAPKHLAVLHLCTLRGRHAGHPHYTWHMSWQCPAGYGLHSAGCSCGRCRRLLPVPGHVLCQGADPGGLIFCQGSQLQEQRPSGAPVGSGPQCTTPGQTFHGDAPGTVEGVARHMIDTPRSRNSG